MRRALPAISLLLVFALHGCAHREIAEPAPGLQLVQMDRSWRYLDIPGREIGTPHYRIFTTDGDREMIERLPLFLETAFARYGRLLPASRSPAEPMVIYLFDRRDQWERFTTEQTGAAASIYRKIQEGGYVDRGRAVFYDLRRLKTFAVTGHEAFHQYVWHYCRHRLPAWLDEGLACYFEGFFFEDDRLVFQPRQNLLRLRALRLGLARRSLLSLDELLRTHPGLVIGRSSSTVASYYAQLWALVLFCQDGQSGKYRARFERLLAEGGSNRMMDRAASAGYRGESADFGPAVFKAYILESGDLAEFQSEFSAYCRELAEL